MSFNFSHTLSLGKGEGAPESSSSQIPNLGGRRNNILGVSPNPQEQLAFSKALAPPPTEIA